MECWCSDLPSESDRERLPELGARHASDLVAELGDRLVDGFAVIILEDRLDL